jgi:hypothetical protein
MLYHSTTNHSHAAHSVLPIDFYEETQLDLIHPMSEANEHLVCGAWR